MSFAHLYITEGRAGTNDDPGDCSDFDLPIVRIVHDGTAYIYEMPQSKEDCREFLGWVDSVFSTHDEVAEWINDSTISFTDKEDRFARRLDAMGFRLLGEDPARDYRWHVARWLLDEDGDRAGASVTVGWCDSLEDCIDLAERVIFSAEMEGV